MATRFGSLDAVSLKPAIARRLPSAPPDWPAGADWNALIERVRAEFLEMPGLALTPAQACRLFALTEPSCALVLRHLTDRGLLRKRADGRYTLKDEAA